MTTAPPIVKGSTVRYRTVTFAIAAWIVAAFAMPAHAQTGRFAIQQIADVLKPLGVAYDPGRPGGGGSDLGSMHTKGMAALTLNQDATYYFDWHHTSNDTLDKIVPAELAQNVAAYAAWTYMAAQADGDFGSAPGAFKGDGAEE